MMINKKSVLRFLPLFAFLFAFISTSVLAQDIPKRPNPPRLVNDFAQVFSKQQTQQLENRLVEFSKSTSTQIVFVSVPSLNGYDKAEFAYEIGERWGVGQKGKDNGIVILFKPKTQASNGQVFIATGYGLEGVIPDATANRIVDTEMIPRFKQGDIFGGVAAAVLTLEKLSLQEFSASQYMKATEKKSKKRKGVGFVPAIILFFVIISLFGRRRRTYSTRGNLPFWATLFAVNSFGRGGSSFGHFSGGSGSFGGGGGFGGFGGGSFGGGGAGGSW